jgi:hypothetical protein
MAETNEYELQALWWKRVLSAFTARHDRQEIPYVVELLRCVGDQRATETAHRAWLLTRRDRAMPSPRSASLWRTPRSWPSCEDCLHRVVRLSQVGISEAPGVVRGGQPGHGSPCDASRYARR